VLVTTLRGLKERYICMAEVAKASVYGPADDEIIPLLAKEAKKRQESGRPLPQGGSERSCHGRAGREKVIEAYLPAQLSDDELGAAIDGVVSRLA